MVEMHGWLDEGGRSMVKGMDAALLAGLTQMRVRSISTVRVEILKM